MQLRTLSLSLAAAALLSGCGIFDNSPYYDQDGPPTFSFGTETESATPRVESFHQASLRPYTVMGKRYVPMTTDSPLVQTGIASWYGKQFHGNKTSIGETYDMYEMSAAHPTMPLPSYAKVTNLQNSKTVIVRVNDRGPFLHDRIIDLSYAAAKALDYADKGTARVRVERLTAADIEGGRTATSAPVTPVAPVAPVTSPAATGGWGIQVGSFSEESNAMRFAGHTEAVLSSNGRNEPVRVVRDGSLWRVIVSGNLPEAQARSLMRTVVQVLGGQAFIIQK